MSATLFQVAIGGATGAVARYLTGVAATRIVGHGMPWGTLVVNVAGSFLIGVVIVLLAERGGNRLAPLMVTGFLGGFTTFSTFSLDALTLWERGQILAATGYVFGTVALSLSAIVAGLALARNLL